MLGPISTWYYDYPIGGDVTFDADRYTVKSGPSREATCT